MRKQSALLAGGVLLACSVSAQAASMAFMNHTILTSIPKQDLADFRATVHDVLESQPDGASSTWTSSAPRRGQPVSVKMTVDHTVETQKASKCRQLDALVSSGAGSEDWSFLFCRQPSGQWKASHD